MEVYEQLQAEFHCDHTLHPVKYTKSNGVICVRLQCVRCGTSGSEKRKADYAIDSLPEWDEGTPIAWRSEKEERRQELYEAHNARIEQERQQQGVEWWEKYNKYLQSQQWYTVRQRVLERDAETCQACLKNKAAHVHHLTYDLYNRLGRSAAFELVAICRVCHEQIHPHMSEAQDRLTLYSPYLNGATNGKHR
jgi:5-methylcytosine-specific restriction endonuclease McrA